MVVWLERPLNSGKKNVSFDYNAFGNRIAKHVFDDNWNLEKSTYYILDAQGNQLSMYELDSNQVNFTLAERNIYGASRLGRTNLAVNMYSPTPEAPINEVLGHRNYELSNHLGNVLTVINDIKIPLSDDNETVSEYHAGIVSISDYSPFGVQLDGRTVSVEGYRYGFNGMERDDELKGMGNSYDFGARLYDSRVGRWLSRDKLEKQYTPLSPYQYCFNSPIYFRDADGNVIIDSNGKPVTLNKDDNGTITFNEDIAPETKKLLDYFLLSDVGQTQLQKMDATVTQITIIASQEAAFNFDENGQYNLIAGITIPGKGKAKEEDGTETFKSAEIILFEGSFDIMIQGTDAIIDDTKYRVYDMDGSLMYEKGKTIKKGSVATSPKNPGPAQQLMMNDREYFYESTVIHESEHTTSDNYKIRKQQGDVESPAINKEKELYQEKKGNN